MENGWIKIHRKLIEHPISRKPNHLALWIHLLMMANHKEDNGFIWNGEIIKQKEGQFITGRKELSRQTGIPESTIEGILGGMEGGEGRGYGLIRQQKTTKYRVITILKWKDYQKSDNKPTTDGQQTDTINNTKKYKNNIFAGQALPKEIVDVIDSFKEINPAFGKWYGNKTQRSAIERMIKVHGCDKILRVTGILPKTNKMAWITTITSPVQLEDKWATLESQLIKEKSKSLVKNKSTPNYVL